MKQEDIVYAVKHIDEDTRMNSRSGGIFTALSDEILSNGGVIYGCALDENFMAYHTRAVTPDERNRFRGSKYIQSRMGDCYQLCEKDLKDGLPVLFSGTPCQIKALNCYLDAKKTDKSKLLTVDILCHSVPSPKVWKKFLEWKSNGQKINAVDFRDKAKFGWEASNETIYVGDKSESSNLYSELYYTNITSHKSCFNCHFKTVERFSDITIGDYWQINELDYSLNDHKGVSLVMINSDKGYDAFQNCSNQLFIRQFPLEKSLQPALKLNYPEPAKRDKFFNDLDKMSFDKLLNKYLHNINPFVKILKRFKALLIR